MKKTFIKVLIAAISISIILVLSELFLRTFYPVYLTGFIGAYQYDETLGVRLKDNVHLLKSTDYQQEIYTNKYGTVNIQDSFSEYNIKIFAIGDSYTQGVGLPLDASYPFQLSMMLNIKNNRFIKQYAVINLGLAAFGTIQATLSLTKYKDIFGSPDYIIYLGSSNDYSDDVLFEQGYRHKHLVEGNPRWGAWLKPIQWLTNDTEVGKRLKIALGQWRRQFHVSPRIPKTQNNKNTPTPSIAKLQKSKLEKLLAKAREMNAHLIVSWADLPTNSPDSYHWLKKWARTNNVPFADWHPLYKSITEAMPNLPITNPHSGGHYRTWVNSIIANSFAEHIHH